MELKDWLNGLTREVMSESIDDLTFIVQGCYEEAMRKRAFKDVTGALSSSIGWAVAVNGSIVRTGGFLAVGSGGSEGRRNGLAALKDLVSDRGVQVMLVAGQPYASYVEAKGFDVTTSGELLLEEMVKWWVNA